MLFLVSRRPPRGQRQTASYPNSAQDVEPVRYRAAAAEHQGGEHRGGYDPFTFDITDALANGDVQELVVAVWDPTDGGDQPRGKQVSKPGGIYYTSVTGILPAASCATGCAA